MIVLAIDTSCDDSCAAIVDTDTRRLLADVVHSHVDPMKRFGGVVPEIASREHLRGLPLAVSEALRQAGIGWRDLDHLAVTNRPGLIGALLVGVSFTKALAFALQRPFSVLNHIEGHLYSAGLAETEGKPAPAFPWITLVCSGGHTELFWVAGETEYRWLGGTRDDAAGEAFDKVGKLLGLDYPAGPRIDRWVRESATDACRSRFAFPRARTEGYDFSYSGLKTAVLQQIQKLGELTPELRLQLAASAQEAILDPLVEKVGKALAELGDARVIVTGGVACNSRLRAKLPQAYFPPPRHCTDNAAMIAWLACLKARNGRLEPATYGAGAEPNLDLGAPEKG
jgi:N6-L-threonylcarbamoyladenine synthase